MARGKPEKGAAIFYGLLFEKFAKKLLHNIAKLAIMDGVNERVYHLILEMANLTHQSISFTIGGEHMVLEKVVSIIAEQLDIDEDKITPDTSLVDDLNADSLDVVDLVMSLEEEFGLEIPDEEVENISTVGDIVKYIEDRQ